MAISFEAFEKMTKKDAYQLYKSKCDDYEKLLNCTASSLKAIETHIIKQASTPVQKQDNAPNRNPQVQIDDISKQPIARTMEPKAFEEKTEHLVIGSSIIKHIKLNDLPADVLIHSYSGSSTIEKTMILEKYEHRPLKTVTLQDGTNSILKQLSKSPEQLFAQYTALLDKIREKFNPSQLFLMEAPPKCANDPDTNKRIEDFNKLLNEYVEQGDNERITIIPLHSKITSLEKTETQSLYTDEVHLNSYKGLLLVKNMIMSKLGDVSSNVPRDERMLTKHRNFNAYSPPNKPSMRHKPYVYRYQPLRNPPMTIKYPHNYQTHNYNHNGESSSFNNYANTMGNYQARHDY